MLFVLDTFPLDLNFILLSYSWWQSCGLGCPLWMPWAKGSPEKDRSLLILPLWKGWWIIRSLLPGTLQGHTLFHLLHITSAWPRGWLRTDVTEVFAALTVWLWLRTRNLFCALHRMRMLSPTQLGLNPDSRVTLSRMLQLSEFMGYMEIINLSTPWGCVEDFGDIV